jgi:hydroxylaminobenzene mutase
MMEEVSVLERSAWRISQGRRLVRLGVLLFLLGLLNGFFIHSAVLPILARSAHLLALMAGTWLVAIGAVWPMLTLSRFASGVGLGLATYSAFLGWLVYLFAALSGAGGMFPLASSNLRGLWAAETIVQIAMITVALAFFMLCMMLLAGLRKPGPPR